MSTALVPVRLSPVDVKSAAADRGWRDVVAAHALPEHAVGAWCATAAAGAGLAIQVSAVAYGCSAMGNVHRVDGVAAVSRRRCLSD